jgi:hypothetical protein
VTDADARRSARADAIREIYAAVDAPVWASPNLDGLADVLRDLSWLPEGPVAVPWPPRSLPPGDRAVIADVLRRAVAETAGAPRPVTVPGLSGR